MTVVHNMCRICGNADLRPVVDLGNQPLSGIFPEPDSPDPERSPLELIVCSGEQACGLVQLRHSADLGQMYGTTYGYRSSTSPAMREHLKKKVDENVALANPRPGEVVLDIGCNDGTSLNFYGGRGLVRIGNDPSSEKFKDSFDPDICVVYDFFSAANVRRLIGDQKCKIVSSIAMLYDIDDPQHFFNEVKAVLAPDGIWRFELSWLPLFLTNVTYDQVCHEHVTYLGMTQIDHMLKKAGLRAIDVFFNEMNGGSFDVIACHENASYVSDQAKIDSILAYEAPLKTFAPYQRFRDRIELHRDDVRTFFANAKAMGKTVYGYGASTKGNITLHYCSLTKDDLVAICDKQAVKSGLVTPGTRIPITTQEAMRAFGPDYLFVLIWHFRREILDDEQAFLEAGGKIVIPLPRLHIIDKTNWRRYYDKAFSDVGFAL
jgi:NDP-4-keto-2,6-dideoxyhexose 3-C-methyltransferase